MAKHEEIVTEIQRLIRKKRLRPGDSIPPERELAQHFHVSYNTIRYANDILCRDGILQRRHGQGTFLAKPVKQGQRTHKRLGLLYVDLTTPLHPYSQALTFAIQRFALQSGYELIVEEMRSEDLLKGKIPEMIRRRSVDALLLDGRVRDQHIRFLEDHQLLYVVLGNCPLGANVPQVRINVERMTYDMTRALLEHGCNPVWCDVDPAEGDQFYVELERFRGYSDAAKEFAPGGALHLCHLHPDKVPTVAALLCKSGLKNAAVIVDHWSAAMLPAALSMYSSTPNDLLIAPIPLRGLCETLKGPNVMQWTDYVEPDPSAEEAVKRLVAVLAGQTEQFHSMSLEMNCQLLTGEDRKRMELKTSWQPTEAFVAERYGHGQAWKHLGTAGDKSGRLHKADEKLGVAS